MTPDEIITAVAQRHGLVTPVPEHFPLSPAFVRECLAAWDAEQKEPTPAMLPHPRGWTAGETQPIV